MALDPIKRIQERYTCPEHKDIVLSRLIELIDGAQEQIRIGIYGYTLGAMTDALIRAAKRGVDVAILFDRTQAAGPAEKAQIARLVTEAAGTIKYWEGTSPEHQIRHSKVLIVDGVWVESGSLNYSPTAFHQNNTVMIEYDREVAALALQDWEANKAWLIANEPQYQPVVEPLAV